MTDTNELALPTDLLPTQWNEDSFRDIAKANDYLSYVALMGSNSKAVKQGLFPIANYALVRGKDDLVPLGTSVDMFVLSWRPKAMSMANDTVVSSYNPSSELFQALQRESLVKDSEAMAGPEFLIYLPSLTEFSTLYMASKTAKNEAPKVKALIGKAANLTARYIEYGKYSWHGIVCKPQTAPIGDLPDPAKMRKVMEKFLNPIEPKTAAAPAAGAETERAR